MPKQTKQTPTLRKVLSDALTRQEIERGVGPAGARAALANLGLIRRLQSAGLLPPDMKAAIRMASEAAPHYLRIAADIKAAGRGDEAAAYLEAKGLGELWGVLDRAVPAPPSVAEREAFQEQAFLERAAAMTPEQLDHAAALAAQSGHPNLKRDLERFKARSEARRVNREATEAAERHKGDKDPAAKWLADPAVQRDAPRWLQALGVRAGEGQTPAAALLEATRGIMEGSTNHNQTVTDLAGRLGVERQEVARILEAVSGADFLGGLQARAAQRDRDEAKARASDMALPHSQLTAAEKARIARDENRRAVLEKGAEALAVGQRPIIENDARKAVLRAGWDRLEGRQPGEGWTPSKRLVAERVERVERERNRPPTPRERMEAAYDAQAEAGTRSRDPKPETEFRPKNEAAQAAERRSALTSAYDAQAGSEGETP